MRCVAGTQRLVVKDEYRLYAVLRKLAFPTNNNGFRADNRDRHAELHGQANAYHGLAGADHAGIQAV